MLINVTSAIWSMFGHDSLHSFNSQFIGPISKPLSPQWSINLDSSVIESSPAISSDGGIFVGTRSSNLHRLSSSGEKNWVSKNAGCELSSPTISLDEETVFCGSLSAKFNALYTNNGKLKWSYDTNGAVWGASTLSDSGSVIYFGSFSSLGGAIHAVDSEKGTMIFKVDAPDSVRAAPAIYNNLIYIGDYSGRFVALSALTGKTIWTATVGDSIRSSAAIVFDLVIFGSYDNFVYALNSTNGKQVWKTKTNNWVQSSPAIYNNSIAVIGSWDGSVYGINVTNGAIAWSTEIGSAVWASAVIDADGRAFVGSEGGSGQKGAAVTCFDASTGKTCWTLTFEGSVEASTVINSEGGLIVASGNGTVEMF